MEFLRSITPYLWTALVLLALALVVIRARRRYKVHHRKLASSARRSAAQKEAAAKRRASKLATERVVDTQQGYAPLNGSNGTDRSLHGRGEL